MDRGVPGQGPPLLQDESMMVTVVGGDSRSLQIEENAKWLTQPGVHVAARLDLSGSIHALRSGNIRADQATA